MGAFLKKILKIQPKTLTFDSVNGRVRVQVSGNNVANSWMSWQIICSGFIDQKVCVELSFLYKKGGSLSSKELRATFKVGHLCTDREKLSLAETGILPSSANIQNICFGLFEARKTDRKTEHAKARFPSYSLILLAFDQSIQKPW